MTPATDGMTPERFVAKWRAATLTERAAAQEHFLDLCRLLDEPTPAEADPFGATYAFEKGATKSTGGNGFADVWKHGHFAWEYKSRGRSLDEAIDQLKRYALALDNPPLLIACNLERFRIVTNWTNAVSARFEFDHADLADPVHRRRLKWAFSEPERLKPGLSRRHVTELAAQKFAALARDLRAHGHDPQDVAHFVNRLVFCMFAEDIGLLPKAMFTRMLQAAARAPEQFESMARQLFAAMKTGGMVGFEHVEFFNGGLFDDESALPLAKPHVDLVLDAAGMDWSEIDPSIMGTLFERGLDPDKRSQLGAHYTDPDKIEKIVGPVVRRPLEAEWAAARAEIEAAMRKAESARSPAARTRAETEAAKHYKAFLDRLRAVRVLDPACGSGNFLYLALQTLKDLEHRAGIEAETFGIAREFPQVGPEQLLGIEINPFAAELARVSVWIGEIQWMQRNGFGIAKNPILRPLDTIECRDALLNEDGTEATWPEADFIVGNPPFLGGKLMRSTMGDDYIDRLFAAYHGRVPREADLVCYWFEKARDLLEKRNARAAGLVATNSIRGGANRRLIERLRTVAAIFDAWSDEAWVVEGAAVRVSLLCFTPQQWVQDESLRLDGTSVSEIFADLTARREDGGFDLTTATRLTENRGVAFMGDTKGGAFDISGELARQWLMFPKNPNGRRNSDVLRPWVNGMDVTRRSSDKWIIDFGWSMDEAETALYEAPFAYAEEHIRAIRVARQGRGYARHWWRHERPRPDMWAKIGECSRYIATPTVAKHRLFVWLSGTVCPDHQLIVIARDDDTTFGILHSRFHELWSLRMGTSLEDRPRYTPSTTFETFPFPEGLTPDIPAAAYADDPRAVRIAEAARHLVKLRDAWLNPSDLVRREPEVVPGYPDRILPIDDEAAKVLKTRTLTRLYNERPAWLDQAHRALDAAVAAAYGWPADLDDDAVLARLLALNLERAAARPTATAAS